MANPIMRAHKLIVMNLHITPTPHLHERFVCVRVRHLLAHDVARLAAALHLMIQALRLKHG